MNITTKKAILIMLAIVLIVGVGGYPLVKMLLPDRDTMDHPAGGMVMETPAPEELAGEEARAKPAPIRFSSMATVHGGEMQYGVFTPETYHWDFGDGTTSYEKDPTHQYEAPGAYYVSLTVASTDGREVTDITEIIVEAPE